MGNMSELMAQARHRISVADYHKMAEAGIFGEDSRVELIDGEIVDMAPIGSRHAFVVSCLARLFTLAARDDYLVSVQNPIRLLISNERQPPESSAGAAASRLRRRAGAARSRS